MILEKPTFKRSLPILRLLRDHPFLSREQLQMILGWRKRTVQWHLGRLSEARLVSMVNGHQSIIATRPLFALTPAGLKQHALCEGMSLEMYLEVSRYHVARLEQLVLVLDRVYLVRSFLLQLKNAQWGWSLTEWDVEVELKLWTFEYDLSIAFHGIARLKNVQGRWITILVEFDMNKAPVWSQRPRLARLIEGLSDERFFNHEGNPWPVLVILAANKDRLNDYHTLLNQLEWIKYDLPSTFLTTQEWWTEFHQSPTALIWKTELWKDEWIALLSKIQGGTRPSADCLPWERLPRTRRFSERAIELKSLAPGTPIAHKRNDLAALSLILYPLDKDSLALTGDHPLLDAVEMAHIKQMPARSIRRSLKRLAQWGLVEARSRPKRLQKRTQQQSRADRQIAKAHCYILTERGLWLLTAWAGFGRAIESYARVRGWKKRFWELVYHWDHTRLENAVYLQFLREARRRGHQIRFWFSELESRIYFDTSNEYFSGRKFHNTRHSRKRTTGFSRPAPFGEWGIELGVSNRREFARVLGHHSSHELKSFLPDSRGVYQDDKQSYTIAVEIDRTRANHEKLWQKLHYYIRSIDSRAQSSWRILIVTTGWQRAANIADLVVQRALIGFSSRDFFNLRGERLIARLQEEKVLDIIQRDLLPVYITTMKTMREQGIASPIWLSAEDVLNGVIGERRYCLECFKPELSNKS